MRECGHSLCGAFVAQRVHRAYAQKLEDQVRSRTTQLRDSERLLESDRERLTAMLTSIADGVAATDGAGRVIMWNSAAEQITGQQVGDVLGQSLHAVLGVADTVTAGDGRGGLLYEHQQAIPKMIIMHRYY